MISRGKVWANFERRVLRIFERALEILQDDKELDLDENPLNRKLDSCVRKANNELNGVNKGIDWPPHYEGHNQPDADDETKAPREDKSPDFQWGVVDFTEPEPARQNKHYVIECKILGKPRSSSWVFNKNYVQNGMLRFVNKDHGYGKSVPSGAMVGYIRDMEADTVLEEVNQHAKNSDINELFLSEDGWNDGGVSRLGQELDRPEVPPTPFSLHHLWVDLSAGGS